MLLKNRSYENLLSFEMQNFLTAFYCNVVTRNLLKQCAQVSGDPLFLVSKLCGLTAILMHGIDTGGGFTIFLVQTSDDGLHISLH